MCGDKTSGIKIAFYNSYFSLDMTKNCDKLVELHFVPSISQIERSFRTRLENSVTIMGVERERSKLLPIFLMSVIRVSAAHGSI